MRPGHCPRSGQSPRPRVIIIIIIITIINYHLVRIVLPLIHPLIAGLIVLVGVQVVVVVVLPERIRE